MSWDNLWWDNLWLNKYNTVLPLSVGMIKGLQTYRSVNDTAAL